MTFNPRIEVHIIDAPSTLAFAALRGMVERITGRVVTPKAYYSYSAKVGVITLPNNDTEGLMHELCHWVMAGPTRRDRSNYSLKTPLEDVLGYIEKRGNNEELMCGWLEEDLYKRAKIPKPKSSAFYRNRYKRQPALRKIALGHRYVNWKDRLLILEILKMPGGGISLWRV